jgi:uncharacterized membrane protein
MKEPAMTLDQFSNVVLPMAAGGLLVYSVRQLAALRDRYWPVRLTTVFLTIAISALAAAASFMRDSSTFQILMARLAEGFGIATLVVLAAAALTGRVPRHTRPA